MPNINKIIYCYRHIVLFKQIEEKLKIIKDNTKRAIFKFQGKTVIHFIHIGKTGGTALKYTLKKYLKKNSIKIIYHGHGKCLDQIPKGDKVILVIRDPVERFLSGFYSRKREDLPRHYYPMSKKEKRGFMQFKTPNDLANALSSKNKDEQKMARYALSSIGHINRNYWDWFKNEKYLIKRKQDILFIGKQETLNRDFEKLKNILKLSPHAKMSSNPVKNHKTPQKFNRKLNKVGKENIKQWYKEDYYFIESLKRNKILE